MFEVIKAGIQTTVQDAGRSGGQSKGVPPSGAQDSFSLRVGNLLVGNPDSGPILSRSKIGSAGLEIALGGLVLKSFDDHLITLTGADTFANIDGIPLPPWSTRIIRKGEILSCGISKRGARAYLAVHGGFDVPLYMNSRSTHLSGQFGGYLGRALKKGDQLRVCKSGIDIDQFSGRSFCKQLIPKYLTPWEVRVISGPEAHIFTKDSLDKFYKYKWKLSQKADRTGMRYIGPKLDFCKGRPKYLIEDAGADSSNIVIDPGAPIGTIQVPSGVEPIILSVDSPTVGGFARIGVVISIDMSRIGQSRPFEETIFKLISTEEAVTLLKEQEKIISDKNIVSNVV
tara:strand:- start:47141 stop:48163 length:1023 start_codon:yes stop_codon:yes gene_type:complete